MIIINKEYSRRIVGTHKHFMDIHDLEFAKLYVNFTVFLEKINKTKELHARFID